MTTLHDTVKAYLLADADILACPCSTRVYVDNWIPDGYVVEDGPLLVLAPRGGPGSIAYVMESQFMVFRSFAVSKDDAFAIDNAVFRAFLKTHNPANATSIYAKDTVSPALGRETQQGGLYVVLSTFQVAKVIS